MPARARLLLALLALVTLARVSSARELSEILSDKGVITPAEKDEATRTRTQTAVQYKPGRTVTTSAGAYRRRCTSEPVDSRRTALAPATRRRLAAALLALAVAGPVSDASVAALDVAAAASLAAAFSAISDDFVKRHPGTDVRTNFAGSPALVRQVREGAPVDVVALADEASMQRLVTDGLVAEPVVFARNRLALVVPRGNPRGVRTLADLARPGLVVALCAPAVPAGRYAREAFARAGVAPPPASEELDVKAVVTRVALGEADAGVVYATDVRAAGDAVEGIPLPEAHDVVARYPIAVAAGAADPERAASFVAFVESEEGRAVLARFGFLAP
jgi:molybdate transport system substrate-binding protein